MYPSQHADEVSVERTCSTAVLGLAYEQFMAGDDLVTPGVQFFAGHDTQICVEEGLRYDVAIALMLLQLP